MHYLKGVPDRAPAARFRVPSQGPLPSQPNPKIHRNTRPSRLHPVSAAVCVHVLLRACAAAPACLLRCFPRAHGARRCSLPSACVMTMQLPCTLGCMPPPVLYCSCMSLPGGTHHMHGGTHPCTGAPIHAPVERLRSQNLSGFASQHPPYHPGCAASLPAPQRLRFPTPSLSPQRLRSQHLSGFASQHPPQHLSGFAFQHLSGFATPSTLWQALPSMRHRRPRPPPFRQPRRSWDAVRGEGGGAARPSRSRPRPRCMA